MITMDFADVARLASGHVEARIIQSAVQLGIFNTIGNNAMDARTVASALGLESRATELMLNALVALQLLHKQSRLFSLSPISARYLSPNSPHYLGGMILFDESLWSCWGKLTDAVRSGRPVRPANMYQENPEETETFIKAMDSLVRARGDGEILADTLDWSTVTELLDVGSGPATYPILLCSKFSHLQVTLFDLPGTIKLTEGYVERAGLKKRIKLIAGNYRHDAIPGRYDAIFLSNIIHGESFEENQKLVVKLSATLEPGGKMIVKDHILDPTRTDPPVGAIFSLLMLLTTERGRCYGLDEVKSWFDAAGLKRVKQINLPSPLNSSLVIGEK